VKPSATRNVTGTTNHGTGNVVGRGEMAPLTAASEAASVRIATFLPVGVMTTCSPRNLTGGGSAASDEPKARNESAAPAC
jgi:hypothetical protein